MQPAQELPVQEGHAGTLPGLADLLQTHSADTIIAWLSASSGSKKDSSGKNAAVLEKLKKYKHLKPHFATNFTDFLHEDCKHLLGAEEPAAAPAPPAAADRPAVERDPAARRRLDAAPAQAASSDRPAAAARAEPGSEGRHHHQNQNQHHGRGGGGGGGRGRRTPRPATEPPRPTAGARRVLLTDLLVTSEPRSGRRRRGTGGRPPGAATPEPPAATASNAVAAAAVSDRMEKIQKRLGVPSDSCGGGGGGGAVLTEDTAFVTPVKQLVRRDTTGASPATPNSAPMAAAAPELVTGAERLSELAALYAHLIEQTLLLGLSIELNFLVRLLVAPGSDGPAPPDVVFLTSIHNAVHFSVQTLWRLRGLLMCLDTANLRLLATNQRLVAFHPALADALLELPASRPCVSPPPGAAAASDDDQERPDSLHFYAELVYRPNFPSDASFNAFRRQHDLLHTLVERWRAAAAAGAGHWDADSVLGEEPRVLVALCRQPVNMHHLARLIQALLLRLAGGAEQQPPTGPLPQTADRTRLAMLNDRFLKPVCVGRAGGRRDFPGAQELFRQLVIRADSAELTAALRDLLASSVLQLDGQTIHLPDAEADAGVQPSTVREVSERIFRLRLLAKFLGLVTFHGLHSDGDIPEQVLTSSIQMRNRLPPPLDLLSCLEGAVHRRQLVITLPWVIEYICMMDRVSVLTSAHQTVFSLLVSVFRSLGRATGLTRHNALFLRLQYENLYEIHSHVQNLCEKDDLASMDRRRMEPLLAEFSRLYLRRESGSASRSPPPPPSPGGTAVTADTCDLVRPSLFYVCCPYLSEQRVALLQFRAGRAYQPSPALRKIIPISAQLVDARTAAARRTQSELEEAFFQSHHPSLRRTVAFVVERLSSALVKRLRGPLLLEETAPLMAPLIKQLPERLRGGEQDYQIKSWLTARLSALVLSEHAELAARLAAASRSRLEELVARALGSLLVAEELTPGARRAAHRLVETGVLSRVNCWLNANLTRDFVQHALEEECRRELRRLRRTTPGPGPEPDETPPSPPPTPPLGDLPDSPAEVQSPSVCLMDLKDAVCGALSGARYPSPEELESLLSRAAAAHSQWNRLLPATGRSLQQLVTDLVTALACGRPELLSAPSAQRAVLACWAALGVDPAAELLAEPIRRRLAAARQPATASGCLRKLLTAAGATPQQLERLESPAKEVVVATEPVKVEVPKERETGRQRRRLSLKTDGAATGQAGFPAGSERPAAETAFEHAARRRLSTEEESPAADRTLEDVSAADDLNTTSSTLKDLSAVDISLKGLSITETPVKNQSATDTSPVSAGVAGIVPRRRGAVTTPAAAVPEHPALAGGDCRRRPPLLQPS